MGADDVAHITKLARWYMGIMASGCLLLYVFRIVRLPRVNQIVILLTLSVLLPPVSADYTLVHLYPAWLILAFVTLELEPGVLRSRVLPLCFKAVALSVLVILLSIYRLEERCPTVGARV
jgi:hypothetical protein